MVRRLDAQLIVRTPQPSRRCTHLAVGTTWVESSGPVSWVKGWRLIAPRQNGMPTGGGRLGGGVLGMGPVAAARPAVIAVGKGA
jgi:hypothetical protein